MTDTPSADNPGGRPLWLPLKDLLGPLEEAAQKYAANYNDDSRQDIRCDVLNAWRAGAKFAQAAERERCASKCLRPAGWLSDAQQRVVDEIRAAILGGA